ncbi:retrograde regulation protein 2, partial [Aspergillus sp. HF37]
MPTDTSNLHAVVDIGSNGIRFSITDLSPSTARTLPTLYHDRAGISLYDAQFAGDADRGKRRPIPDEVIDRAVVRLARFKLVCRDFGVSDANVHVLATEAVRAAPNGDGFRERVRDGTHGWAV